jgi:hypothetical protein
MHKSTKPGEHGRASLRRKTATVLRLLRAEDLELVSRELGVAFANSFGCADDFSPPFSNLGLLDLSQIHRDVLARLQKARDRARVMLDDDMAS